MIYADPPRKYRKQGKRWSHLCSPDHHGLEDYARTHGLKRKHTTPWLHYDVTAEELEALPGITHVTRRELSTLMHRYRKPKAYHAAKN